MHSEPPRGIEPLFSPGEDAYQRLKEAKRLLMTIDGDPVVEIDIKASYLTVLYGRLGLPFDPTKDPYAVEGLAVGPFRDRPDLLRRVVKAWTVATLGHHRHHTRWPDNVIDDFQAETGLTLGKVLPISAVRAAMEARHPVLKQWGDLGLSWADLMFTESEGVLRTMVELMDKVEAPSFSVHDSLIVRENDCDVAKESLSRNYEAMCGIRPALEVTNTNGTIW